jgi:calcineurin-like phosphoesterase family protein
MQFFTSDPHLGHANCIRYCNRPFADAHEMNKGIIERWNSVVGDDDEIFLLGDVSFSGVEATISMLKMLRGTKYLVFGNHDRRFRHNERFLSCFAWAKDYHELYVEDSDARDGKQLIVLFHYPISGWNTSRHGSWHLHGHRHGGLDARNATRGLKRYDVGVDSNEYAPISYLQLKEVMRTREYNTDCDEEDSRITQLEARVRELEGQLSNAI